MASGGMAGVADGVRVEGVDDEEGNGVAESGDKVTSGIDRGTPGLLHAERMKQSHRMNGENNPLDFMFSPHKKMAFIVISLFLTLIVSHYDSIKKSLSGMMDK